MNIVNYKDEVVKYFIARFRDAGHSDHDTRWRAARLIAAIAGQHVAENWLRTHHEKQCDINGYQLDKEQNSDPNYACNTLCKLSKYQLNYDVKAEVLRDYAGHDTLPEVNLKKEEKPPVARKKEETEKELQKAKRAESRLEYNKRYYAELKERFANGRTVVDDDFFGNQYLFAKSSIPLELAGNIRISGHCILIKAENTSIIQEIDPRKPKEKQKLCWKCQKEDSKGKKGSYTKVSTAHIEDGDDIYIVEGIATAFPFVEAGFHVYWAIDAGNLRHATAELKAKYPNSSITIGADNDRSTAGIINAQKCGNVKIALPPLTEKEKELRAVDAEANKNKNLNVENSLKSANKKIEYVSPKSVDWNDIWLNRGAGGFSCQLDIALKDRSVYDLPIEFDSRYLSDAINVESLIGAKTVIKSLQGTGKTTLAIQLIKACLELGNKIVIVAPSRSLSKSLKRELRKALKKIFKNSKEYIISLYSDFSRSLKNLQFFNRSDIIITTPQSATKVHFLANEDYTFIVDELDTVVNTFVNNATHKSNFLSNRDIIQKGIVNSSTFLAIDANLSDATKLFVENAKTEQKADCEIRYSTNKFKHKDRVAEVCKREVLAINMLVDIYMGKKFPIAVTSKSMGLDIEAIIKKHYPDKKVLIYNGSDSDSKEAQEFLEDKDATKYDYVIYNTALGVGVDITNHCYDTVYCFADEVFGITANAVQQLIQRFRNIKKYKLSVTRKYRPDGEDPYYFIGEEIPNSDDVGSCLEKMIERKIMQDYLDSGKDKALKSYTAKIHKGSLSEQELILQKQVNDCKNWAYNVIGVLFDAGLNVDINQEEATEEQAEYIQNLFAEAKKDRKTALTKEYKERMLLGYLEKKNNKDDSLTLFKQGRKTDITIALKDMKKGKAKEQIEYKFLKNNRLFSEVLSNIALLSKNEAEFRLYARDARINDPTFYLDRKGFLYSRRKLLKALANFAGLDTTTGEFRGNSWSSRYDIVKLFDFLDSLGIKSSNPLETVKKLLLSIGLVVKARQKKIPENELKEEQKTSSKVYRYREYYIENADVYNNVRKYIINTPEDSEELKVIIEFVDTEIHKVLKLLAYQDAEVKPPDKILQPA